MDAQVDIPRPSPEGVPPLLEEHHLVIVGDERIDRLGFARALADCLRGMPDAHVVHLPGRGVIDLPSFCRSVTESLGLSKATDESIEGVIESFRARPVDARFQYLIWDDADTLLESNVDLFGAVVNAMLAVAAEHEYLSPDRLILQRVVFIGGDKLGAYAEDGEGQFSCWRHHPELADVASSVQRPPVLTYRLDG